MKTYQVINSCVRQPFNPRMFKAGEVIELEDDVDPGANFKLMDSAPRKKAKGDGAMSLSGLQKTQAKASKAKSGFASDLGDKKGKKTNKT